MKKLVLIVGSRGMLGQDLMHYLKQINYNVIGLGSNKLDITDRIQVLECLSNLSPRVVVNCAAYTNVDRAEAEKELAFAVNRDGAAHLAEGCTLVDACLIHISTDYVFSGTLKRPYREDDLAEPLNTYGKSKWEGEEKVRSRLQRYIIIRTAWMYGKFGRNFVKTIINLARSKETLRVVSDQLGSPTWSLHLAKAISQITLKAISSPADIPWGTYHYCGEGSTTWFGFAKAIINEARRYETLAIKRLIPITSDDYPTEARRPANSALDCSRIRKQFNIETYPWQTALEQFLKALLDTKF